MNTPIKSYAQIVSENIQLREKIRRIEGEKLTLALKHSVVLEGLRKLMNDKVDWYEKELQKSYKVAADAIALAKGVSHAADQAQAQAEKVLKMS